MRPRWQRDFLQWLAIEKHRLQLACAVIHRTDRSIELRMPSLPVPAREVLAVHVRRNSLLVIAEYQGHVYDLLFDAEVWPRRIGPHAYHDMRLLPALRRPFPSAGEMRRQHVYEAFLCWLNQQVNAARWIGLYLDGAEGQPAGGSYARLLTTERDLDTATHPEAARFPPLVRADGVTLPHDRTRWRAIVVPLTSEAQAREIG